MSSTELHIRIDGLPNSINRALRDLYRGTKKRPKKIYIAKWIASEIKGRYVARPIYDLGDLPDAQKRIKKQTDAEKHKRYRQKAKLIKGSSVFALGMRMRDCYKNHGQLTKAKKVGSSRVYIDGKKI